MNIDEKYVLLDWLLEHGLMEDLEVVLEHMDRVAPPEIQIIEDEPSPRLAFIWLGGFFHIYNSGTFAASRLEQMISSYGDPPFINGIHDNRIFVFYRPTILEPGAPRPRQINEDRFYLRYYP